MPRQTAPIGLVPGLSVMLTTRRTRLAFVTQAGRCDRRELKPPRVHAMRDMQAARVLAHHGAITRVMPLTNFKSFRTARATIMGIELVHMIRKGQVRPLDSGSDAQ